MFTMRRSGFTEYVVLRCQCHGTPLNIEPIEKFDEITEKYCIIKDGASITCRHCGYVQTSDDNYIPFDDTPSGIMPRCPTCSSYKVEKISAGTKFVGFATVGVFSKNFGKTFCCKQCGYRW